MFDHTNENFWEAVGMSEDKMHELYDAAKRMAFENPKSVVIEMVLEEFSDPLEIAVVMFVAGHIRQYAIMMHALDEAHAAAPNEITNIDGELFLVWKEIRGIRAI